jgi:hypothetical protein
VLDDHSRYAICLEACAHERGATIQARLRELFRRYGLPDQMPMDNGGVWGRTCIRQAYTPFSVWLLRLGIRVSYGRPYHPQMLGNNKATSAFSVDISRSAAGSLPVGGRTPHKHRWCARGVLRLLAPAGRSISGCHPQRVESGDECVTMSPHTYTPFLRSVHRVPPTMCMVAERHCSPQFGRLPQCA